MPIPELRPDGYLPEGLFFATEAEAETAFGTVNVRRQTLMRRLSYFLQLARAAGTLRFFVNGSFVTAKPEPGDVDAVCLVPTGWSAETSVTTGELYEVALARLPNPKNFSSPIQKVVGISGWNSLVAPANLMDGVRVL
jgi:hypothetical protein